MNYRHAFHAGNFADVFKHAFLMIALETLCAKDKPFVVVDTHAGIGLYDLKGIQAGKTGEWEQGIGRLLARTDCPDALASYVQAVRSLNAAPAGEAGEAGIRWYPGSPLLTAMHLRETDRLVACELHPDDAPALAANLRRPEVRHKTLRVEQGDGYAALKGLVPPAERRGLVLIDPPFERRDEQNAIVRALRGAVRRWASGSYAVWYPIKDPAEIAAFHDALATLSEDGVTSAWALDLMIRPPRFADTLNGCGFAFINPPWGVLKAADTVMPWLTDLLEQDAGARWSSRWLIGEG